MDTTALPSPLLRRLKTLGHGLTRLRVASEVLRRRTAKGTGINGVDQAWLSAWGGEVLAGSLRMPVDTGLSSTIEWLEKEWLVTRPVDTETLPLSWLVALLWLHLPALRHFWRKELRAQRFALFQRVLPQVWPLDTAPLPPGATISGLKLASWSDLPRLLESGRRFEAISLSTDERQSVTAPNWPGILARAAEEKLLLIEHRQLPDASLFTASWTTDENGWIGLPQQTA
jgi:hypothetical protein